MKKAALRLSEVLARRGIIAGEDVEVYAYGLELMISTAVNIVCVIILSLAFFTPLSWILFLLPFIPLRTTAGGFHAKTHLGCLAVFCVAYVLLLLPTIYFPAYLTPAVLVSISAVNLLLVLLLSPIPAASKPLDETRKKRNRKRSIIYASVTLAVTALSFTAGQGLLRFFVYFALGQAGAGISMIAAFILKGRENTDEKVL